jgi:hypothetical protein
VRLHKCEHSIVSDSKAYRKGAAYLPHRIGAGLFDIQNYLERPLHVPRIFSADSPPFVYFTSQISKHGTYKEEIAVPENLSGKNFNKTFLNCVDIETYKILLEFDSKHSRYS